MRPASLIVLTLLTLGLSCTGNALADDPTFKQPADAELAAWKLRMRERMHPLGPNATQSWKTWKYLGLHQFSEGAESEHVHLYVADSNDGRQLISPNLVRIYAVRRSLYALSIRRINGMSGVRFQKIETDKDGAILQFQPYRELPAGASIEDYPLMKQKILVRIRRQGGELVAENYH